MSKVKSAGRLASNTSQWRSSDISLIKNYFKEIKV